MSIKTTHIITRRFALKVVTKKLMEIAANKNEMGDEKLADVVEILLHNGFYNFSIVSEEEFAENRTREHPFPYLDDIDNLPEENDAY